MQKTPENGHSFGKRKDKINFKIEPSPWFGIRNNYCNIFELYSKNRHTQTTYFSYKNVGFC